MTNDEDAVTALFARRVPADPVVRTSAPTPAVEAISFLGASPDPSTHPWGQLAEVVQSVLSERNAGVLDYDIGPGITPLRATIATRLAARSGISLSADQITVTHGAAGAIDAAAAVLLEPGDVVFVEEFTYRTGMKSFRDRGAELIVCPADHEGLVIDDLASLIRRTHTDGKRPKMVYFCANFSNPTGITLSVSRREQLGLLAERENVVLLQDDTYSQIRFLTPEPRPMLAYAPNHTILVGSTSKVLTPALRLGWSASSPRLAAALASVRIDLGVSVFIQRVADALLAPPWFDEHLSRAVDLYRAKQQRAWEFVSALSTHLTATSQPEGGFYLWLTMHGGSADEFAASSAARGVRVMPQSYFSPASSDGPRFRLGFSHVPIEQLDEGLRRLAVALDAYWPANKSS